MILCQKCEEPPREDSTYIGFLPLLALNPGEGSLIQDEGTFPGV